MATTLIIVAYRLIVPLSIFRWPFFGAVASIVADALDIVFITLLHRYAGMPLAWNYHELDKYLDTYYLAIEVMVAQGWPQLPRLIASVLFVDRLIGVVLFETTGIRVFLFVFPALIDFYFLFYTAARQFAPGYELTPKRHVAWLGVLLVPKMFQEYAIHYARWLDNIVAVDVIRHVAEAILHFIRDAFTAVRVGYLNLQTGITLR
jgi:hypothetical protein